MGPASCVVGPRGCQRRPGVQSLITFQRRHTAPIIRIPTAAQAFSPTFLSPIPAAQTSFRSGGTMYPWIDLLIGIFTWLGLFAFTGAMLAGVIG